MAIKYTASINNEIAKTVRNFNQKIARLEKSERDLILPEKVSIRELKKEVNNKWELNRKLKELQRYSTRGIERTITTKGGVTTSLYELINLEKEQKRLYAKLGRSIERIGNITPTVFGVKQDATFKQMGSEQLSNLKARRKAISSRNVYKSSKEELKTLKTLINKTVQKENYITQVFKNNYIDKMLFNLGYASGYDKDKLEYIRNNLLTLNERQFLKLFNTDEGIRAIRDYYPETHRKSLEYNLDTINELYDALYDNISDIVEDYKK